MFDWTKFAVDHGETSHTVFSVSIKISDFRWPWAVGHYTLYGITCHVLQYTQVYGTCRAHL